LAVTLQFFGRFARVNAPDLGDAKFLAVPSELDQDLLDLFDESDTWGKKVRLLGQQTIGAEVEAQDFLQSFEEVLTQDPNPPLEDLSLHSFSLFNHVKVHEVHGTIDLRHEPAVTGFTTERVWLNEDEATVAFLIREEVRPQWATTPGLDRIEHHLVVVYWDEAARLLFVCSSHREEALYKEVVSGFVKGRFRTLSLNKTNRVLRPFANLELFNVGIRNRATGIVAESYRQITGSSAQNALQKGDAALYHRGHIFGRGETPSGSTTIGVSSLGKVWRLDHSRISELVKWCRLLAADIANPTPFKTGIQIDHFDVGKDIEEIPDEVILAVDWDEQVYRHPFRLEFTTSIGIVRASSALDFDLVVVHERIDTKTIHFALNIDDFSTTLAYSLDPVPSVVYADDQQPKLRVVRGYSGKDFVEFVGEEHLRFHLADGSVLQGSELFPPMGEEEVLFDAAERSSEIDWKAASVDITVEYYKDGVQAAVGDRLKSIHEWLKDELANSDAVAVLYDHRPGEAADFIAVYADEENRSLVKLYHCKASDAPATEPLTPTRSPVRPLSPQNTGTRNGCSSM
jgi:hypothetical protein